MTITAPALTTALQQARLRLGAAWWRVADRAGQGFARLDIAHDLAEEIGSPRWYRGAGVMLGSAAMALTMWPGAAHFSTPRATAIDAATREEYRSQIVMPLAFGGDTGRMAAPGALVRAVAAAPERPSLQLSATLAPGDTLGAMLTRAGVGAGDTAGLLTAIGGAMPVGQIVPGTRFDFTLGRHDAPGTPRPLEDMRFRARFGLDLAISRAGAGWHVERRELAVDATPLRIRGVIGGSLYGSARAAGAPMKAIQQYLQAVDAHLSLDDLHPGATFDMVLAYRRSADGEAQVGDLLYAGIEEPGGKRAQLLRWGDERGGEQGGASQFFDAASMSDARVSNALVMPVAGARITSGFGMRYHPILGYARMHSGTDLAAAYGSPVYAVADGMVTWAGWHGGHGNYIRLDHGGGVQTGYGHLSRYAVQGGMRVHAGEVIGYVGSTGLSTGPHLHYEVFRGGASIDPMSVHFTVRAAVDKREIAAFRAKLAGLLAVRPGAALGPVGAPSRVAVAPRANQVAYR